MLSVEGLEVRYGRIRAVRGVDLTIPDGGRLAVLGPNGAGKSSLLKAITGVVRPHHGKITWQGRDITRLSPHQILRRGIAHVPEGRAVIAPLTVRENLEMGAYITARREIPQLRDEMLELFPSLERRLEMPAGSLSGGEQQMLAIARGLMAKPHLVAIDEPSMGLAPSVATDVLRGLTSVAARGTSILVVEQNAALAMRIADRLLLLNHGELQASGSTDELGHDVLAAYVE